MELIQSRTRATVCRMLNVYAPGKFDGNRPAVVTTERGDGLVNANVFLDGTRDQAFLAECRGRPEGNTFPGLTVYDQLTPEARELAANLHPDGWAEWPHRTP